jgi:plasmid maintenance system antidote protein VapI
MSEETKGVVKKGDRFAAMGAVAEVLRAGAKWADIEVRQTGGATWRKRQPLPLPSDWRRLAPRQEVAIWEPQWTIHPGVHWREIIEESGRSQAKVAEEMGVSEKHLSQILTCTVMPGVEATMKFASVMEVSPRLLWRLACDHKLDLALGKTDLTKDYL